MKTTILLKITPFLSYIAIVLASLLFAACGSSSPPSSAKPFSTTYYVATDHTANNRNTGFIDAPWRTIQFAIDHLISGDTLIIKAGIYTETLVFSGDEHSGVEGLEITLKGLEGAVIDATGLTPKGTQGIITLNNAHHLIIENLELRNFKTAKGNEMKDTPIGLLITGRSHHISVINTHIHHIENRSSCGQSKDCDAAANGIAVYGNTPTAITDLRFINNEISHCILAASEAFTLNGNIDGFQLINNVVHDNNNIGIDIIGYESDICPDCTEEQNRARNGILRGNRAINNSTHLPLGDFSHNPWYEGDSGSAGGFYVDGGHHILFDGNTASNNDIGFEFASEHAKKSSEDILMMNNIVYANREAGLSLGGYAKNDTGAGGGTAKNLTISNNSFYKNQGWGTEINIAYRVSKTLLANNIFYGNGTLADNVSAVKQSSDQTIRWVNNLWWATDTNDTTGTKGSSIIKDPLFIDPTQGNFNVKANSPVIDHAILQDDITTWTQSFWQNEFTTGSLPAHGTHDINGAARIKRTLDIGATEH